jgi:hypothetical protein
MVPSMGDDELLQNVSYKMHGVGGNIGDYYKIIFAKQNKIILFLKKTTICCHIVAKLHKHKENGGGAFVGVRSF